MWHTYTHTPSSPLCRSVKTSTSLLLLLLPLHTLHYYQRNGGGCEVEEEWKGGWANEGQEEEGKVDSSSFQEFVLLLAASIGHCYHKRTTKKHKCRLYKVIMCNMVLLRQHSDLPITSTTVYTQSLSLRSLSGSHSSFSIHVHKLAFIVLFVNVILALPPPCFTVSTVQALS